MARKNKLIISCASIGVIGLVVFGVFRYMNSSAVGTVQNQTGLSKVKGAQLTLKEQKTEHYVIQISDDLYLKTSYIDESRPIYAQYMYAGVDFASDTQLSVSLGRLSEPSLNEISYVKQRLLETGTYIVVSESPSRIVFRTNDNTEYAVFWLRGSGFASIVGTGLSSNFQTTKENVEQAERSWQWRN